jgi:protein-L-isoaspartate(D-aspartate) O-methyltransferase
MIFTSNDPAIVTLLGFGTTDWRSVRRRMVRYQLHRRGVTNSRVLAAMASVPREAFVPATLRRRAYADAPLPIGNGQTISQPFMVALMTEAMGMTRRSRVLEIGTGSGYQAAVLAKIAQHVWTIERFEELRGRAEQRLTQLGIANVTVIHGDGAAGHPPAAPYDAILVTAAAPTPPPPLLDQLSPGGRLVIPVGDLALQQLMVYERTDTGFRKRAVTPCRFVPLVSPHAFPG